MPRRKLETEAELPASAAKKANANELLLYNPSAPENNADENILDPAEYFFKNTRYHNCHLIVGNPPEVETIGVISLHLIGHSTVFRRMLQDSDLADPTGVNTKITDVRPEIFKLILRHVYGGQLPDMDQDTAAELLLSADKYNIQPLVCKASALLKPTSVEDVFPALRCVIYVSLSLPELTTQVAKIVQENTYELIKSKQFLQLDINCLEFITKQESLIISELELWECLVDWAKNQAPTKELRKLLDKPLRHVRFLTMTVDDFVKNVVPHRILEPEEVVDILAATNNKKLENSYLCSIRDIREGYDGYEGYGYEDFAAQYGRLI